MTPTEEMLATSARVLGTPRKRPSVKGGLETKWEGVKTVGAIVVLLLYNALAIAFWVIVAIVVFNLLMILL
jgi:hypothetical protein